MTYEDRLKAFEMRLIGMTWDQIAAELHYGSSSIAAEMRSIVNGRAMRGACIYPAMRQIINRDYNGSIYKFAEASGLPYGRVYNCLTGRTIPSKTGQLICDFLKMTPEQVFGKKDAF